MKINIVNDGYYNIKEFSKLYSETIASETIESLKTSASNGNLRSIELLNNLALRSDESGRLAEKYLFDMFCGTIPTDNKSGVLENIQDSALMLYQLSVNDKMKNNTDMQKLRAPSKLLYIAGAAADTGERLSLSRVFSQMHRAHSQHEQIDDVDLWNPARMLSTDEVNAAIKLHTRHYNTPEINFPIGLIHPDSHENMLSQQIVDQRQHDSFLEQPEFFPVNTGEHWVTFGLYKEGDAQTHAVICNTGNILSPETKQHLIDSAHLAGVTDPGNIEFLENNIQEHIPNGCGLLTVEAMKRLMENNFQSPNETLENFLFSFTQVSVAEQERYNLENRYRIYAQTWLQ